MRTRDRSQRLLSMLLLAAALTGCVAPAANSGAFTQNAVGALSSAVSETRTAAIAVQARLDDKVTQPYVNTVVTETETAMGPIQDSFGSVDPPTRRDDRLRDEVTSLLGDASDALSAARIAVRRQSSPEMRSSVRELNDLADQMEQAKDRLS